MSKFVREVKTPLMLTLVLFLICGLIYPLLLTGISQVLFANQANGSLITVEGKAVGSSLIGQDFTDIRFMKGRPSAVKYNTYTLKDKESGNYTGVSSGSNNYSTTNKELTKRVEEDLIEFLKNNSSVKIQDIPADLLTASGSGLDPHISHQAALIQIKGLSLSNNLSEDRLIEIVNENTDKKILGIFGEETVNVLKVNLQIAKDLNIISKAE